MIQATRPRPADFYDGIKFRVGKVATNPRTCPPIPAIPSRPKVDERKIRLPRDLPRIGVLISEGVVKKEDFPEKLRNKTNFEQLALIADARNDENLIIAQLHTAVLRFHNAVVDWVKANEPNDYHGYKRSQAQLFERAQQLTRWHYQWLVVNDYLKTMTVAGIVDNVLLGGPKHYRRATASRTCPWSSPSPPTASATQWSAPPTTKPQLWAARQA